MSTRISFPMERYMMVSHGMSNYMIVSNEMPNYLLHNSQPNNFNKRKYVDPSKNYSDSKKIKLTDK
ncbi:hypothetical protein [Megavirus chiliensis]|nr:hypothetical protein MegaChil _gp0076 [Megavirus chiliensis]AEQ32990.1 hypothetical protein [Megavirus chiliensis]AGD91970.1 hypothetical protein LBA_00048 [Megavirus lba]